MNRITQTQMNSRSFLAALAAGFVLAKLVPKNDEDETGEENLAEAN